MVSRSGSAAVATSGQPTLLDGLVGYLLRRASTRMMSDFSATMAPLDLRPVLFAMLEVVRTRPGIIQMALGTELGIQRANLVPLINELSGRGLIERKPAPRDRRAFALFLTPKGKALIAEAEELVHAHEERMIAALSRAERTTLLELLAKITKD